MNEEQRKKVFEYVYQKADEAEFLGMDSASSSAFQSSLESDPDLQEIAGEKLERKYIKDTVLNRYSKDRRYIELDDVLAVINDITGEHIVEKNPDFNNDVFHILYNGHSIACTSTSIDQWQTAIKRFGKASGEPRLVFLTCKGVEKDLSELSSAKEVLQSYGISSVFVKPNQPPISITSLVPEVAASKENQLMEFNSIASALQGGLEKAGIRFSYDLAIRFICAQLSKRFCILTGLSGSGKTKLAHAFAAWITESKDQYRLVAVGADWTTNENVVGYQDALQTGVYRKPSNGALDVILRAHDESERAKDGGAPARPYFLILDEMNLSHVERYFADILSAVESGQEVALHSAAENLKANEDDPLTVPPKLCLPDNLFIVGTVNVDETTYMFSPKVLDRANVIEFRATAGDIAAFLDAPSKVDMDALAGKGAAFGPAFVAEASADAQLDGATAADLKARLTEIFDALAPIGAEFGFRTAYEITRFTHFHAKLTGDGWQFKDALDAQVLQKLMPKLHGSERKLGPVLEALHGFCTNYHCDSSLVKIERMQNRLRTDGFTSFAEA